MFTLVFPNTCTSFHCKYDTTMTIGCCYYNCLLLCIYVLLLFVECWPRLCVSTFYNITLHIRLIEVVKCNHTTLHLTHSHIIQEYTSSALIDWLIDKPVATRWASDLIVSFQTDICFCIWTSLACIVNHCCALVFFIQLMIASAVKTPVHE